MNYFAHGRRFLDDPYFLAGTAVPDWLNVVNRQLRARSKSARRLVAHSDRRQAAVARGIIQHHHDDDWFHQTRAFAELQLDFSKSIRDLLEPDDGFRPSFLGHILVELLLDATLIEDDVSLLDRYYTVLATVDASVVAAAVTEISGHPADMLTSFIPQFSSLRFLYDYRDDGKLLTRLNNVMHRVQLAPLPAELVGLFPAARQAVRARKSELLAGEVETIRHAP
jgi:hypothetical protein